VGFKYEKIYQNNTKEELETLKKSEVATTQPFKTNTPKRSALQPEGSAKAGLVVSTRDKKFKRTPPNQAGPL